MGYHVKILRTQHKHAVPISKDEVQGLPKVFPEWRYDPTQDALVSTGESDEAAALWFSDGELWTKNPSDDTLTSMVALATYLGARVRGDEFETYRSADDVYLHPEDVQAKAEADAEMGALVRRTRRKQWLFNAVLFGSFISVIFVLKRIGFLE